MVQRFDAVDADLLTVDIQKRGDIASVEIRSAFDEPATCGLEHSRRNRGIVQHNRGAVEAREVAKGDVLQVARIAGIMGAKQTPTLIPMCHPLEITNVEVDLWPDAEGQRVCIEARVRNRGRTGVEMEALTAVTVAGLTVYDMCKSLDRQMRLADVELLYKSGGKSGEYRHREFQQ